ncbi:hypothetical protein GGI20_002546 [Coemansia sp. BCRC 34301]|nr:hypothetical protein GGI20_002546 [Coemansia sp. BCRC 34301]
MLVSLTPLSSTTTTRTIRQRQILPPIPRDMLSAPDTAYDEAGLAAVTHYAVSALRTANAFTVPFERLAETTAEAAVHDAAAKDEACKWLVGQLAPYHCHPLSLPSAMPRRKCIIYLEPRRTSTLYAAIEQFFTMSASLYGPTEAHMYHPHCSMTGFIDIPADDSGGSSGLVAQIANHLDTLIETLVVSSLRGRTKMPRLLRVNTACDYPHPGTHKIEAKLDTPSVFREIVDAMQKLVPEARIRPKRIGHISLAYYNKHVQTEHRIEDGLAAEMHKLAESLLPVAAPSPATAEENRWDIALYELALESAALFIPHRFNQIARWHL